MQKYVRLRPEHDVHQIIYNERHELIDAHGLPFVSLVCHISRTDTLRDIEGMHVELKTPPGTKGCIWHAVFQDCDEHCPLSDVHEYWNTPLWCDDNNVIPLRLDSSFEEGRNWTDFYQDGRKVARVVTNFYINNFDKHGNKHPLA